MTELGKQIPVLAGVVNSALETITSDSSSPTGMIVSQLAKELATKLDQLLNLLALTISPIPYGILTLEKLLDKI